MIIPFSWGKQSAPGSPLPAQRLCTTEQRRRGAGAQRVMLPGKSLLLMASGRRSGRVCKNLNPNGPGGILKIKKKLPISWMK